MTEFAVNWDYRCPFARNAHEHLIEGLRAGAGWDVRFVPFSLGQVHVKEGEPDIWVRPQDDRGLLALQAGVVVRDKFPDQFLDAQGVDADAVFAEIESGAALDQVRIEHTATAEELDAWGVPTFMQGDRAVFVRLMERPQGDGEVAQRTIDRVLDLLGDFPQLNEFKHTSLKR